MTKRPRNPQPDPRPESKEPRGRRAKKPGAPGVSRCPDNAPGSPNENPPYSRRGPGLDSEISMLRGRLRKFIKARYVPNRDAQLTKTLDLLIRALAAKSRLYPGSSAPTEDAIEDMLREASEKFGLKIIPWESNC